MNEEMERILRIFRNVLIFFFFWRFCLTFFLFQDWNKIDSRNRNFFFRQDRSIDFMLGEKLEILFDLLGTITIRGTWKELNSDWPIRKFFHGTNGWADHRCILDFEQNAKLEISRR